MNSLRIEKKGVYKIEVNDNGDYIEFDLADVNLPFNCYKALDDLDKLQIEINKKQEEAQKKENNERELIELEKEFFERQRQIVDSFLGKGACQKIFGSRNYYGMFEDLIDELTRPREELKGKSHFDMLDITSNGIKNRIAKKYNKHKKRVI